MGKIYENNLVALYPPSEFFADGAFRIENKDKVIDPGQQITPVTSVFCPEEGGIWVFHKGDKFPMKGWPFKEAVFACDIIKRAVINSLKFALSSPVRYVTGLFFLLPRTLKRAVIRSAVRQFASFTGIVFTRYGVYWKPHYFCDMVREIHRVGMKMAESSCPLRKELEGGREEFCEDPNCSECAPARFVIAICMVLEFDDAYRYRIQDLLGEMDQEAFLENPGKETARLFAISQERGNGIHEKLAVFEKAIALVLRGDLRAYALKFFTEADINKMRMDEKDWYRCMIWSGWDFGGISLKERLSMRMMIDAEWQENQKQKQTVDKTQ